MQLKKEINCRSCAGTWLFFDAFNDVERWLNQHVEPDQENAQHKHVNESAGDMAVHPVRGQAQAEREQCQNVAADAECGMDRLDNDRRDNVAHLI